MCSNNKTLYNYRTWLGSRQTRYLVYRDALDLYLDKILQNFITVVYNFQFLKSLFSKLGCSRPIRIIGCSFILHVQPVASAEYFYYLRPISGIYYFNSITLLASCSHPVVFSIQIDYFETVHSRFIVLPRCLPSIVLFSFPYLHSITTRASLLLFAPVRLKY